MRKIIQARRPSAALVVAFMALFVALSGVGYTAAKINGKKLKNRSVAGKKLKRNTVTGTEVNESKLGKVPAATAADRATSATTASSATTATSATTASSATTATSATNASTVGGVAPEAFTIGRNTGSSCNPGSSAFVDCGTVSLTLPRSGRVLVVANAQWDGNGGSGGVGVAVSGQCRLELDGTAVGGTTVYPGSATGAGVGYDGTNEGGTGINTVTASLAAGAHTFRLACSQVGGNMSYDETYVSAVMLGTD